MCGAPGACPQPCTPESPREWQRHQNQGSRGTSSVESVILARTSEPAGREVADPSTAGDRPDAEHLSRAARYTPSKDRPAATVPVPAEHSLCLQGVNAMQTAFSQVMLSVPAGRGTGREGTRGSCLVPGPAGGEGVSSLEGRLPRTSAHPNLAAVSSGASPSTSAFSAWGSSEQGGDRWGQAGLRPQQVLFPFTAKMASSTLCSRHVPHWAKQGTPQDGSRATFRRSQVLVSSEQSWAPGRTPRPGSTEPGKHRQDTGRVRTGLRTGSSRGRAHGGSGHAFNSPQGPRLQPEDGGAQQSARRHRRLGQSPG